MLYLVEGDESASPSFEDNPDTGDNSVWSNFKCFL